jgi:RNA polymerase sigma factor (sigma-70 family)
LAETQPLTGSVSDFSELLRRAAQGDSESQQEICMRYEQQVRIVVRVMLSPQLRRYVDSVDLVQSVHQCFIEGLAEQKFQISSPEKLIALASTLARRKVARKWRNNRLRVVADTQGSNLDDPTEGPEATSPEQAAQYHEQLHLVLEQLNVAQRTMLEMRLEGYSNEEIAQRLDIHPAALRVRWTRLKQQLQANPVVKQLFD